MNTFWSRIVLILGDISLLLLGSVLLVLLISGLLALALLEVLLVWTLLVLAISLVLRLLAGLLPDLLVSRHHGWWRHTVLLILTTVLSLRLWLKVLVWIESSEDCHLSDGGDLNHGLVVHWVELEVRHDEGLWLIIGVLVIVTFVLLVVPYLVGHWWKGNSLWKIWQWVDEPSPLLLVVIEGASVSELALAVLQHVLAGLSLIVRVNCAKGSLTKVLWKWIIWLSKFLWSMCKLAVLLK